MIELLNNDQGPVSCHPENITTDGAYVLEICGSKLILYEKPYHDPDASHTAREDNRVR